MKAFVEFKDAYDGARVVLRRSSIDFVQELPGSEATKLETPLGQVRVEVGVGTSRFIVAGTIAQVLQLIGFCPSCSAAAGVHGSPCANEEANAL